LVSFSFESHNNKYIINLCEIQKTVKSTLYESVNLKLPPIEQRERHLSDRQETQTGHQPPANI